MKTAMLQTQRTLYCTGKGEFLTLNFDVRLCKVNPFLEKNG